jgi:hypothetical protein
MKENPDISHPKLKKVFALEESMNYERITVAGSGVKLFTRAMHGTIVPKMSSVIVLTFTEPCSAGSLALLSSKSSKKFLREVGTFSVTLPPYLPYHG